MSFQYKRAKVQNKVCAEIIMFILSQMAFDAFTTNECQIATLVYEYVQRIILHSKQFTDFAPTGYSFATIGKEILKKFRDLILIKILKQTFWD